MIININNPPLHAVAISRQGENEFREIVIDVSAWLAEWPDGKISVIYCRPDGELYPVIVNATESPIVWRPTATDTAVSGVGAIEVRVQIGDVLGKSCKIAAKVLGALGAPGEAPAAPAPDWAQTVTEDADRAEAAAGKAEAASTHMPQISASKTWLVWDAEAGEYVDTGVSAAGEKGDDGDPGKAPIIGENGNWYEWDETAGAYTDTGKPSRGEKGNTGAEGADGADGRDGITPTIGENGNWYLGDTDTGKPSRGEKGDEGQPGKDGRDGSPGKDGVPGADGQDGITPTIGENGNWYLGETDTGKPSRGSDGATGATGATGEKGTDGKSAYAYAVEGGYTGTEEEFAAKMAKEQLTGTTGTLTPTQVYEAVSAGIPVKVQYTDGTYGLLSFMAFNVAESLNVIVSQTIVYFHGVYILAELIGEKSVGKWEAMFTTLAQKTDIPSALPNPNALTFTGAVTGSYDGSTPLSVNIPSAVTDDHINSLIDTKLGVIENGSY